MISRKKSPRLKVLLGNQVREKFVLLSHISSHPCRCRISTWGQTNWGKQLHFLFSLWLTWFFFTVSEKIPLFCIKNSLSDTFISLSPFFLLLRRVYLGALCPHKLCLRAPVDTHTHTHTHTQSLSRALSSQCGGLNLAHEKCRWIRPLPFATGHENVSRFQSPGVVHHVQNFWEICQAVQPASSAGWRKWKKKKKRENLVFYFLNFKGASPSQRGHLKAQLCLTLLYTFLLSFFHPFSYRHQGFD